MSPVSFFACLFVNKVNVRKGLLYPQVFQNAATTLRLSNKRFSIPQISPDGVVNQMEGLSMTSKYKRTWVNPNDRSFIYKNAKPDKNKSLYSAAPELGVDSLKVVRGVLKPSSRDDAAVSSRLLRSYDKKAPPVSMSKLLSHGYVEDKKKSPNDDDDASSTIRGSHQVYEGRWLATLNYVCVKI